MHRMIFEDFKDLMPNCQLTFACPYEFHQAVIDHPFLDRVIDLPQITMEEWGVMYDTSHACNRYELLTAPNCDKHRSDIWAEHCGVTLKKHNMHFCLSEQEKLWAREFIGSMNPDGKRTVLVAPRSAMSNKNLEPHQIDPVIEQISGEYCVFGIHNIGLDNYGFKFITGTNIRQLISLINESDYVITVDTSVCHCAGGLGKPLVAIFAWADGLTYGKYYPRMVLVQKHRNLDPSWDCGPCYKFPNCCKCPDPTVLRKPCITEITSEMILDGFNKMVSIYNDASNL